MNILTREAILQADDLKREAVEVPEWGGTVYVRTLTGAERDAFEADMVTDGVKGKANLSNLRAKLCARTIVDEEGEHLFGDGDVVALGNKSAAALDRVFDVSQRMNGLGVEDVEALVKNSEIAPADDSPSD